MICRLHELGIVLEVDPNRVFGHGAHPTTQLAMRALVSRLTPDARVLDLGCGSGVLAIAAARLGAGAVVAADIDAEARRTCSANAERNGVTIEVCDDLDAAAARGPFDLVVANILAGTLIELARPIEASAPPGGLVLSGILEERADAVQAAYRRDLGVADRLDGWVVLVG